MKNLKKLSKEELKTVNGSASVCPKGYYWCSPAGGCIPEGRTCCL
ncbi:hypothetical protein HNP38_003053 [Chryseobacterium defluvii]|uniref:Bacteriocin-like protein n=1 Tax=Chryseobacterium defluvii TaxID=160396 RepID=A0A840KIH7_9FLAO|nr:hypothetical protein [Chryseobacterium defluvii]MBB4807737.1 hypothetical protein [Chryseobacterium defluvii]